MELASLLLLLEAAAAVAGKTVVQEATKSAYNQVKGKFLELFGRRGADSLAAIEACPSDPKARSELSKFVESLNEAEQKELAPLTAALLAAFKADPEAQAAARQLAAIRLDVTAGDNVVIQRIEGATVVDIKADAGKDFVLTDVKLKGSDPGN